MAQRQLIFRNDKNGPIYVSVEPWPKCFELEPGEELKLIFESHENESNTQINFANEQELVVWPGDGVDDIIYLLNGKDAEHLNWIFKRYQESQ